MGNILDKKDRSIHSLPGTNGMAKEDVWNWAKPKDMGAFRLIAKGDLNIDDTYQRDKKSERAVQRIARTWDWSLFNTVQVAERPDGSLWVFDGGHRVRAAFYRSDIRLLPCMVFKWDNVHDEARAFLGGAKMRSNINSRDAFKAAVVAQEPTALATHTLLEKHGLRIGTSGAGGGTLRCIGAIQDAVKENPDRADAVLALCLRIAGQEQIDQSVFRGLFRLAQHSNGTDIIGTHAEKLLAFPQNEINKAIRAYKVEVAKGGDGVEAQAIMRLINKSTRGRKLKW